MQSVDVVAEHTPCYVDEQTGLPITIAGLPYKDVILLITAINESIIQSNKQPMKKDALPAVLPTLPPMEMGMLAATPSIPPDQASMLGDISRQIPGTPMSLQGPGGQFQIQISWLYVARRSSLPEAVCKTVWAFLQECVTPYTNPNSPELVQVLTKNPQGGASIHGAKDPLESYRAALQASGRTKISIPTITHGQTPHTRPAPSDISQKKRFTESEDRLLLMALLFHDGNFELIHSRYFQNYQLSYIKSRYNATLKKHAMTKAGMSKASDLKSLLSETSKSKIKAELVYLFPWLESAHITEELLTATARSIGCL